MIHHRNLQILVETTWSPSFSCPELQIAKVSVDISPEINVDWTITLYLPINVHGVYKGHLVDCDFSDEAALHSAKADWMEENKYTDRGEGEL
jgi:hypothetical protein